MAASPPCRSLAVSMVVHHWRPEMIRPAIASLDRSLRLARSAAGLERAELFILYNGDAELDVSRCQAELATLSGFSVTIRRLAENAGYGAANNVLIRDPETAARFDALLVANTDIVVDEWAITRMLRRMAGTPRAGIVTPRLLDPMTGADLFACKRYPSLCVLAGRMLPALQRLGPIERLNARYEYREFQPLQEGFEGVEMCSGCFMLAPMAFWQDLGGFDSRFFMYFEDFDLSIRSSKRGWINIHEPTAIIRHAGGGVGKKSWPHRWWFIRSAVRFFSIHGWRFWRVGGGV